MHKIELIECPRDAMQGWKNFIPTEQKIEYINTLLQVGFHTIDFGSFVSAKAIPQMADTAEVIKKIDVKNSSTKLLAIVANKRGAEEAINYSIIDYLGFPFSISPTFQQRNTNSTQAESLIRVDEIQELCIQHNKKLVVYLSMGFGNPYNDDYNDEILLHWANEMIKRNVSIISLADTVGLGTPEQISFALNTLIPTYTSTTFGVHLHCTQHNLQEKLQAAINANCIRFDGALKGIGGCPMAQNDLVGNMDTEKMIHRLKIQNLFTNYNKEYLMQSLAIADNIFK